MQSYLFLCTIGPVQSFIAQARKTKDLFNGSKLLSELIRVGIEAIPESEREIIFPHLNSEASYPNRFLAELKDCKDPQLIGESVEAAIHEHLEFLGKEILDQQKDRMLFSDEHQGLLMAAEEVEQLTPQGFIEQLANHLEVFWLALPLKSADNYKEAYRSIESKMGAIKNVRPCRQLKYQSEFDGEQGRKCSLDGERNAIFVKKPKKLPAENSIVRSLNNAVFMDTFQLKRGEGLSAVSFLKRFWKTQEDLFESVAGIALADTLIRIQTLESTSIGPCQYLGSLNDHLFYQAFTGDKKGFRKIMEETKSDVRHDFVREQQQTLWNIVNKINQRTDLPDFIFTPYYALLMFDGDNMGAWLAGSEELIHTDTDLKEYHSKVAQVLNKFAIEAKKIVEAEGRRKGRIVYAGGDDLMAFVNINHLFPVLHQLRLEFKNIVNTPLSSFAKPDKEISFSAGICVAHVKEPLSIVLGKARKMEKDTKTHFKDNGKDGFGIELLKGSGEIHRFFWKTHLVPNEDNDKQTNSNLLFMHELCLQLRSGLFSDNFIINLDRAFSPLSNDGYLGINPNLVRRDMERLIWRSYKGEVGKKETACSSLFHLLTKLYDQQSEQWTNFISTLHILNFIENELNYPYAAKI